MRIGIIIAIERELEAFLSLGKQIKKITKNNRTIYITNINQNEIYAIKSGFGPLDSSSACQLLITGFDCELILNFGVTGALDKNLKVEDLFVVNKALDYDFDVSNIDSVKKHQYEDYIDEFIPLNNAYIQKALTINPSLKLATVASGGQFIDDKKIKEELFNQGCNICDMEIAAIARACFLSNIPCLSIKCISDTYDGDGSDFVKNVSRSAKKAFDVLYQIINNI